MTRMVPIILALVWALAPGCSGNGAAQAPHPRIISYSPGVTDILYDLDLGDHLVGVTSWCIVPPGSDKAIVGNALTPNSEMILALQPDLVFVQQDPAKLRDVLQGRPAAKVVNVSADTIEGILSAIRTVAREAGEPDRGEKLAGEIAVRLDGIRRRVAGRAKPRALFLMGFDRPATAGAETLIDEIIVLAGGVNAAAEKYQRWPVINAEMIQSLAPDVIVCQVNGPEEAGQARTRLSGLSGLPAGCRVVITDERRLTILGSRVAETAEFFAEAIHPGAATSPSAATREAVP